MLSLLEFDAGDLCEVILSGALFRLQPACILVDHVRTLLPVTIAALE